MQCKRDYVKRLPILEEEAKVIVVDEGRGYFSIKNDARSDLVCASSVNFKWI